MQVRSYSPFLDMDFQNLQFGGRAMELEAAKNAGSKKAKLGYVCEKQRRI